MFASLYLLAVARPTPAIKHVGQDSKTKAACQFYKFTNVIWLFLSEGKDGANVYLRLRRLEECILHVYYMQLLILHLSALVSLPHFFFF